MALKASLAEAASAVIGGGKTGGSHSADPVAKGAVGLPNSKNGSGDKTVIPAGTSVDSGLNSEDTPNDSNVKPTNANSGKNMSTIKAKPSDASSKMENLEIVFAGTELSEETKEQMATLFETAVNTRVSEIESELTEKYNIDLETSITEAVTQLVDVTNDYLEKIAQDWVAENELAVESSIKTQISESFMAGLKTLFEDHYIDIPENKVDVVEELASRVSELEEQLNSEVENNIQLKNDLDQKLCEEILVTGVSDLTDIQRDKVKNLAEGISFSDPEDFRKKLVLIKENYIATVKTGDSERMTTDVVQLTEDAAPKAIVDPIIANFAKNLGATLKK